MSTESRVLFFFRWMNEFSFSLGRSTITLSVSGTSFKATQRNESLLCEYWSHISLSTTKTFETDQKKPILFVAFLPKCVVLCSLWTPIGFSFWNSTRLNNLFWHCSTHQISWFSEETKTLWPYSVTVMNSHQNVLNMAVCHFRRICVYQKQWIF